MQFNSPRSLARFNALIITLFVILLTVIYSLLFSELTVFGVVIIAIPVYVASYFLISSTLENFFYKKIKLIYKTIHNLKRPKGQKTSTIDVNERDVLEK
ncbi:MAG: hypothetical protein WC151_12180, partial [Bacteroidales bacterium]